MIRTVPAVPAVPMTTMGIQRCLSRSITLPQLQDAPMYSLEKRPPIAVEPNQKNPIYRSNKAKRKANQKLVLKSLRNQMVRKGAGKAPCTLKFKIVRELCGFFLKTLFWTLL